jgi:hypothetical protein
VDYHAVLPRRRVHRAKLRVESRENAREEAVP